MGKNNLNWEARFQELADYKRVQGDCNVPHVYIANMKLGRWVGNQRKKKESISGERRKQLDSIGFVWKVRKAHIIIDWEIRFKQLVEYKRVHGNCNVLRDYKANQHLGRWVARQRTHKETLSEERQKRLDSIGFTWKFREAVDWEVRFQELADYKRLQGDCNVPQGYNSNQHLGRWVSVQRTNKETMSEERQKRLNSIGFTWKVREAHIIVDWEVRFKQLVEYKLVHGNCNTPREYNANPQLGYWVNNQRTKEETMSEERREKLNSIGFTWKGRFQQGVD